MSSTHRNPSTARRTCARTHCRRPEARGGARGLCKAHYEHWRSHNPTVPAAVVAEHIQAIRGTGIGWDRLAEMCGVPARTLRRIVTPIQKYVQSDIAAAVLAVPVPREPLVGLADGAQVDGSGTRRRLQALTALGYTNIAIAEAIGNDWPCHMRRLMRGDNKVRANAARLVADAFRRLQLTPPPDSTASLRARRRAERHGWPPPLAWDEDTIDNPAAQPYSCTGTADFAELIADYRGIGCDDSEIARRLGMSLNTLQCRLRRAGIDRRGPAARVAS